MDTALNLGGPMSDVTTRKRFALAVLAISQLMVVLDATIVNVALERISTALEFRSESDLSWVVTGYALTFGGFLLLGGRLADRFGRRLMFMSGTTLFAVASLLGGLATNQELLIAARTLQGLGGALMSPSALSLLTVVFAEGRERDRALGIWAGITAGGAALGLVLGGVLTEYLSWRWVFFINIPIAVLSVVGTLRFVPESRDTKATGFDVPGAILATTGLMALVYGLVRGNALGWGSVQTVGTFVLAAVLLAAFVVVQKRARTPLVPFRLFSSRSLTGADSAALLVGAGIFGIFFFLTLWMQVINGYSPIKAGFAFLPMPFLIGAGAAVSAQLLGRTGPRPLLVSGLGTASLGLIHLSLRLEPHSSYLTVVLPSLALVAIGMGLAFVALTSAAVAGVPHEDAGIASALLNAGQQIGGALGLAILTAVSTSRTASVLGEGFSTQSLRPAPGAAPLDAGARERIFDGLNTGWVGGFWVAAAFLAAGALVAFLFIRVSKEDAERALKDGLVAA
ncbi:MAG TPA: DHA2 family efflux MFS transporter permease subunit [Mycobacteriales bacterium]|nr:DHA2 family efflux MFS transporter permease subunit [Mycobacteriales bacterium]